MDLREIRREGVVSIIWLRIGTSGGGPSENCTEPAGSIKGAKFRER
jgi:hypothetical protein